MAFWLRIIYLGFTAYWGLWAVMALISGNGRQFLFGSLLTWGGVWLLKNSPDSY